MDKYDLVEYEHGHYTKWLNLAKSLELDEEKKSLEMINSFFWNGSMPKKTEKEGKTKKKSKEKKK